ncbi:TM186 protein, partial [Polypterus senegalus]
MKCNPPGSGLYNPKQHMREASLSITSLYSSDTRNMAATSRLSLKASCETLAVVGRNVHYRSRPLMTSSLHLKCGCQLPGAPANVLGTKRFVQKYSSAVAPKKNSETEENKGHLDEKFTLLYRFPAIKFLRVVSRLKLLQTGITIVVLPSVYYLYVQGEATYTLFAYSTGIAIFAAVMLYSMSHYLRRVIGMMYLNESKTVLKVSHLTFWGKRHDFHVPVHDVIPLGDTGDSHNEVLLQLKRYSQPEVLYFTCRLGQVIDSERFTHVFGKP